MIEFKPSTRKGKKMMVTINKVTYHFGSDVGKTFIDHGDKKKKAAWIARHLKNKEGRIIFLNPLSLSYYILWGDSTDINKNIEKFKKEFKL